jgi:hypothetical protein
MIHDNDVDDISSYDREESLKEFKYLFSIYELENMLLGNNKNVEDPKFLELSEKNNLDIDMAQIIDDHLHSDDLIEILNKFDFSRLMVLWKNSFKDAKIGDEINGGKVIGIFTLTIWIFLNEDTGHEYCCNSSNCKE